MNLQGDDCRILTFDAAADSEPRLGTYPDGSFFSMAHIWRTRDGKPVLWKGQANWYYVSSSGTTLALCVLSVSDGDAITLYRAQRALGR